MDPSRRLEAATGAPECSTRILDWEGKQANGHNTDIKTSNLLIPVQSYGTDAIKLHESLKRQRKEGRKDIIMLWGVLVASAIYAEKGRLS